MDKENWDGRGFPWLDQDRARQANLKAIFGTWRMLIALGEVEVANTIINFDRDRQGIEYGEKKLNS